LSWIAYCINTPGTPEKNPLGDVSGVVEAAKFFHGGVKELREDKDIDNDGMSDHYFTCYDGTIIYDCSRNLLKGKYHSMQRTWYRQWK